MMKLEEEEAILVFDEDLVQDAATVDSIHANSGDESDEDDKPKKDENEDILIRTRDIGIWRVFYQDSPWSFLPGADIVRRTKDLLKAIPYVWRFLREMWAIAPGYLVLWSLLN